MTLPQLSSPSSIQIRAGFSDITVGSSTADVRPRPTSMTGRHPPQREAQAPEGPSSGQVTQLHWVLGKKGITHQSWALCSMGLMYYCSQFTSLFQVLSLSPHIHFAPLQSADSFHSLQTKRFSKTRAFKISDSDTRVPTDIRQLPHHSQGTMAGAAPCLHPGREEVPLFFWKTRGQNKNMFGIDMPSSN